MKDKDRELLENLNVIVTEHLEAEESARSSWGPPIRLGALLLMLFVIALLSLGIYGIYDLGYDSGRTAKIDSYETRDKQLNKRYDDLLSKYCQLTSCSNVWNNGVWQ